MNRKLISLVLIVILLVTVPATGVMGATINKRAYVTKVIDGKITYSTEVMVGEKTYHIEPHKKIIRTYKQLKELKKYIKNTYPNYRKQLRALKKYDKKYFKKNVLVYTTEVVDRNAKDYELNSLEKQGNKLKVNIDEVYLLEPGMATTCEMEYCTKTFIIGMKKAKMRNVKSIKVKINSMFN